MLPAHINGPDHGAQIYGVQSIPHPPARSAFNGEGGGEGGGSGIADNICAHLDGPWLSA
jgi:hypothetical protein